MPHSRLCFKTNLYLCPSFPTVASPQKQVLAFAAWQWYSMSPFFPSPFLPFRCSPRSLSPFHQHLIRSAGLILLPEALQWPRAGAVASAAADTRTQLVKQRQQMTCRIFHWPPCFITFFLPQLGVVCDLLCWSGIFGVQRSKHLFSLPCSWGKAERSAVTAAVTMLLLGPSGAAVTNGSLWTCWFNLQHL